MKTTQCLEYLKPQMSTPSTNDRPPERRPQPSHPPAWPLRPGPGWGTFGLALLLILAAAATAAATETVPVNLTLTSPGTYNVLNSSLTIYVEQLDQSESGTGNPMNASGNVTASLGITFNPTSGAVNSVDQLTYTGGTIALTDPHYVVTGYTYLLLPAGGFNVDGSSLQATEYTTNAPSSVSGGSFNASDHEHLLIGGTLTVTGTGLIGSSMSPNPTVVAPSAQYPIALLPSGSGTVTVTLASLVNRVGTYNVTVLMPANCPERTVYPSPGYPDIGAVIGMQTSGTLQFTGTFTRVIPATDTWDGSGDMNWTQPDSTSWSGQTFYSGDTAQFLGAGLGTVNIPTNVTPAAVIVNASGNYNFAGAGGFGGSGGLTKSGTGEVTLTGSYGYSGSTVINAGTVEVQGSFYPAYSYYKFTPTVMRSGTIVALSELQFFLNGVWTPAASVTNPGGNNPNGSAEAPANANDNNVTTKWTDLNGGALIYHFSSPQSFNAYNFSTDNCCTERDPIRWKVEGSNDGSTWTMVDDKTGADQSITTSYESWAGPGNTRFPGWTIPGSVGKAPVSIAGGATLRLNYPTVLPPVWANISGAGTLDLNSAQPVNASADWGTLSLGSGFTGKLLLENGRVDTIPTELGGTSAVEVRSGAQVLFYDGTLNLNTYTYPQSYTIAGTGWGESAYPAALRAAGQSAILNGPVTLAGDATVLQDAGSQLTFNGIISGGYNLTVQASDQPVIFGAANTYNGATVVTAGTLQLSHSLALQSSTLNLAGGTIAFDSSVGSHAFTFGGLSGSGDIGLQDNSFNSVTVSVGNNNASTAYSGNLTGGGALTKSGTGTLTLGGASTYTGSTTVNAGTLAVNGSLNTGSGTYSDNSGGTLRLNGSFTTGGDVSVTGTLGGAGTINAYVTVYGTVFPNSPGGTLTVANSLSLFGATVMAVNRDSGSPLSDRLSASTLYRYSSLVVTNTGIHSLRSGDTLTLFNWTSASGSFSPVTLPPLMPGLTWVNNLSTSGTLSISGTGTPPRIRSSVYSGSNVTFSGTGGVARGTYYVLASTNAAAPKSSWTPVATNLFDASGNFSFSAGVNSSPRRFYAIAVP